MTDDRDVENGLVLRAGQRVPTGHDSRTEEGQRALANLMMFGAQAGAAAANVREVMRRHRPSAGPIAASPIDRSFPTIRCLACYEPWARGVAAVDGCSTYLLADAIEGVLWVASNRPAGAS